MRYITTTRNTKTPPKQLCLFHVSSAPANPAPVFKTGALNRSATHPGSALLREVRFVARFKRAVRSKFFGLCRSALRISIGLLFTFCKP